MSGPALDHPLGTMVNNTTASAHPSFAVPLGEIVILAGGARGVTVSAAPTVADDGANTYANAVAVVRGGGASALTVGYAVTAHALSTSSTIQASIPTGNVVTLNGASFAEVSPSPYAAAFAFNVPNTGGVCSISTSGSVNAGDLVVAFATAGSFRDLVEPFPWQTVNITALSGAGNPGGTNVQAWLAYLVPTSGGVVTGSPSVPIAGSQLDMAIVAFRRASARGVLLL